MKKLFLIGWIGGFAVGAVVGARFTRYHFESAHEILPLKVKILNGCGANIKVKTCVEQ